MLFHEILYGFENRSGWPHFGQNYIGINNILNQQSLHVIIMKQINLLCVILTCYSATSLQFYSHKASTLSNPSWMSQLDNGIPLRQVSIIGSHSSMSQGTWGDAFQTQSNSLTNQMVMGMRALDIRCRHYQDKLQVYVRIISLNTDLGGVLSTVRSFLQVQNMEVILMHIVEEGSASGNSGTF